MSSFSHWRVSERFSSERIALKVDVIGPGRASFNPEILQAGAVKGLIARLLAYRNRRLTLPYMYEVFGYTETPKASQPIKAQRERERDRQTDREGGMGRETEREMGGGGEKEREGWGWGEKQRERGERERGEREREKKERETESERERESN